MGPLTRDGLWLGVDRWQLRLSRNGSHDALETGRPATTSYCCENRCSFVWMREPVEIISTDFTNSPLKTELSTVAI
jgi:hypothetical protein